MDYTPIIQWFAGLANVAVGFLLGSIITGVFTWKVVVPKVMKNKDIQELKQLFAESKTYLKELLEKGR